MVRFLVCLVVLLAITLGAILVLDRCRTLTITIAMNGSAPTQPVVAPFAGHGPKTAR